MISGKFGTGLGFPLQFSMIKFKKFMIYFSIFSWVSELKL